MGKWTEGDVFRVLSERRYSKPAWAFMHQVADATGHAQRRWADAVAVGLWPSRGLEIHGIEIKVSRSDWRRELKKPDKAENVAAYCDRWWIAAPKDVVPVDELPEGWGLLEITESKVKARKEAPKMDAKPIDRSFFAAMTRRLFESQSPAEQLAQVREEAKREALREAEERMGDAVDRAQARANEASGELLRLKNALHGATPHDIGRAVRAMRSLTGGHGELNALRSNARKVQEQADTIEAAAQSLFGDEQQAEASHG